MFFKKYFKIYHFSGLENYSDSFKIYSGVFKIFFLALTKSRFDNLYPW